MNRILIQLLIVIIYWILYTLGSNIVFIWEWTMVLKGVGLRALAGSRRKSCRGFRWIFAGERVMLRRFTPHWRCVYEQSPHLRWQIVTPQISCQTAAKARGNLLNVMSRVYSISTSLCSLPARQRLLSWLSWRFATDFPGYYWTQIHGYPGNCSVYIGLVIVSFYTYLTFLKVTGYPAQCT